jgi:hypothetical protein
MRRGLLLGWGVAGVIASGSAASAQFAADRSPPPASPPAATAVAPQTTPPAAAAVASQTPPPAAPPQAAHPWYVKPDVGGWMILVKAYSGTGSREMAERLAADLRETYKVPAYLFERGAEERQRERERVTKEMERQRREQTAAFLQLTERMRAEAMAQGREFVESPPRVRVATVRIEEQWAVLVGGWPTMDAASKQLAVIRRWPAPKDATLLDVSSVVRPGADGQATGERAYLNPFHTARVARNPVAPRAPDAESQTDPLVLKMNQDEEYSVLRIGKPWTIVAKAFYVPVNEVKGKDDGRSVFARVFNPKPDMMHATAAQAREMVKVLRSPDMKPRPLEAYVLHTLNGSLVCVGQFDDKDDPRMTAEAALLDGMGSDIRATKDGPVIERRRMFDALVALRVK